MRKKPVLAKPQYKVYMDSIWGYKYVFMLGDLDKALELNPDGVFALYMRKGQLAKALDDCNGLLEHNPNVAYMIRKRLFMQSEDSNAMDEQIQQSRGPTR